MISIIENTSIPKRFLAIISLSILLSNIFPWAIVLGSLYLCFLYPDKKAFYSITFLLLVLAVGSFIFIGFNNSNITVQMFIYYSFASFCCYGVGCRIIDYGKSASDILYAFAIIIISLALPHIIVTVYDIFTVGLVNPDRELSTLSSEDNQRSVCQRTVEISLCIGSIAFFFFKPFNTISFKTKRMLVIAACVCELCALHYVSRTGIAILCIGIFIGLLFKWGVSFKTCLFILCLMIGFHFIQNTQLFEVFNSRESDYSNISNVGLRTVRWEWGIEEIRTHPFGSTTYMNALHSNAHNFWIDYGKISGIIPFVLLIIFSLRNIYQTLRVILKKMRLMSYFALVFTPIFVATLMTEPIHEGAPLYMFMYFLYTGMIDRLSFRRKLIQ